MSENRVIGIDNQLPWRLPADLGWFKKNTLNKPVVMGRKTWESLPFRPLPQRLNFIITRDKNYQPVNAKGNEIIEVRLVNSVAEAITAAKNDGYQELMFIGGAMLYEEILPRADRLYLTLVKDEFEGDAWFPQIDLSQWRESYHQENKADEQNQHQYCFSIYDRIQFND
jgi:dihydrofolate reductase